MHLDKRSIYATSNLVVFLLRTNGFFVSLFPPKLFQSKIQPVRDRLVRDSV